MDLGDARSTVERWRLDYNMVRPNSSVGYVPPTDFRTKRNLGLTQPERETPELSLSMVQI